MFVNGLNVTFGTIVLIITFEISPDRDTERTLANKILNDSDCEFGPFYGFETSDVNKNRSFEFKKIVNNCQSDNLKFEYRINAEMEMLKTALSNDQTIKFADATDFEIMSKKFGDFENFEMIQCDLCDLAFEYSFQCTTHYFEGHFY